MATTEQRSGFRLPWASEERPGTILNGRTRTPEDGDQDAPEDPTPTDAPEAIDSEPVETAMSSEPSSPEASEMQETALQDTQMTDWPEEDTAPVGSVQPADAPAADPADASAAPDVDTDATPAADRVTDPVAAPAQRARRDNPLVAGLVRAMRDAASSAREETAARFAEDAKARVELIQARSAEEATELRKQADAEIVEIRDWSKAEMARIREETDERIAGRRAQLDSDVERHAASVENRIERVNAAVTAFERRMDSFFEELLAEEDPAHVATLAEQLPEPPDLDAEDDLPVLREAAPEPEVATLDAQGAEAAEAEAFAGLYSDDETVEAEDDGSGGESVTEIAEEDVVRRLEAFTAQAAPAGDATIGRLAVTGLVSVASIAGFKRALARTPGIRAVTVASGPSGEFVFTITHDPETDLRAVVPSLEGFAATITGDDDGVLTVTATDPDSSH